MFFPSSPFLATEKISPQREELASSKKSTERTSATINSVLEQHVDTRRKKKERTDTLMIFHHWYIAQTVFPGQNTRFSYADQSLSPLFAQQEDLWLVSGHMHRAFIRERAICI